MTILAEVFAALAEQAEAALGEECCGILWGETEMIEGFTACFDTSFADRFSLSQEWLLEQFYRVRREEKLVLGYYHSHPKGEAEPSFRDLQGHPPGSFLLILSNSPQRTRAFRLDWYGERAEEVVLNIV